MEDKNQTFIIREFKDGDEFGIHEAHMKSIRELCAKDYSSTQIESWTSRRTPQSYLDSIVKNGERFRVIETKEIIVGFSGWYGDQIKGFYLHPAYVGRGWGRELFKVTEEDFLKNSGFRYCVIESTTTAKPFYECMGFQVVKPFKHIFSDGITMDAWEMRKQYI